MHVVGPEKVRQAAWRCWFFMIVSSKYRSAHHTHRFLQYFTELYTAYRARNTHIAHSLLSHSVSMTLRYTLFYYHSWLRVGRTRGLDAYPILVHTLLESIFSALRGLGANRFFFERALHVRA